MKARIPIRLGTQKCCGLLKTRSLLDALAEAANSTPLLAAPAATKKNPAPRSASIPSAIRSANGTPKISAPSSGISINARHHKGESIRIFPLSNWTELDVWLYIHAEEIPIVPLYFAKEREGVVRGNSVVLLQSRHATAAG